MKTQISKVLALAVVAGALASNASAYNWSADYVRCMAPIYRNIPPGKAPPASTITPQQVQSVFAAVLQSYFRSILGIG